MKTNLTITKSLALVALLILNFQLLIASAQTTVITYQGRLNDGANPANGNYDFRFTVYDATNNGNIVVGPITNTAVAVTNGQFTTLMDFGVGPSSSQAIWLDVAVRTNGNAGGFTPLTPRTLITPVPLAYFANTASNLTGTLPASQLSGTLPASVLAGCSGPVTLTNGGNSFNGTFSGTFSGSGVGLTGVAGTIAWQNVTGTSQQAQPNTGYLANNASQVTITLPTAPNLGDIVRVSGVGAGGWIIAQNAGQAIQASQFGAITTTNWNSLTNWTQTSAPGEYWYSIASSADGTKLAAVDYVGIYTSTNSGLNWTQTSAPNEDWDSIASSADGSKLAAVVYRGAIVGICSSTNSGLTWTQTSAPGNAAWYFIASSADGTKLAAATSYVIGIYTSTNSGVNWTQTSAPIQDWHSIACSTDGTKLAAVVWLGGIYTSTNSGLTWIQTSAPSEYWSCIASSADGTKLAAVVDGGGIYTSTNSGVTWNQTSAPLMPSWSCITSSADGTKLVAAANGNGSGIYTSTNSGLTWIQTSAPSEYWSCIASSADGTKLAATVEANGGRIWTAQATVQQATTTPGTAGYLTGGQNSAIELQYIGNGQFMPLNYVGPISAY